jgi:uncharacterized protein with gpF-like domain
MHGFSPIKDGDNALVGSASIPVIADDGIPDPVDETLGTVEELPGRLRSTKAFAFNPRTGYETWAKSIGKEETGKMVARLQLDEENRFREVIAQWIERSRKGVLDGMRSILESGATYTQDALERSTNIDFIKEDLLRSIESHLSRAALAGAMTEWHLHAPRSKSEMRMLRKGWIENLLGVPQAVADTVADWTAWILGMEQWENVAENIVNDVATHYEEELAGNQGSVEALDATEKAMLDPEDLDDRASSIAATEAATAVGAGQDASREVLQKAGVVVYKEWMSMGDNRVRDTHRQAHGQRVEVGDDFVVGGYTCSYPGDPNLPPSERCGCRCVSIGVS